MFVECSVGQLIGKNLSLRGLLMAAQSHQPNKKLYELHRQLTCPDLIYRHSGQSLLFCP